MSTKDENAARQSYIDPEKASADLLFVTQLGFVRLVDEALKQGANINIQDARGMTPLHHAAARGARPCIRVLVNHGGCDYLIRDNDGRYAFELAIEWARDYAVSRLLLKKQIQQAAKQGVAAYVPRE